MAWRCSGPNQSALTSNLAQAGILKSLPAQEAMARTDRQNYVVPGTPAYMDSPQPLGYGQTISAPHMHAYALDLTQDKLHPGAKILDVGSGSGYLSACFARLVAPNGKVYGIETVEDLVKASIENVKKGDKDLLESNILSIQVGDGWKGLQDEAPFDVIHVGAAAEKIPEALKLQLKPDGGRLIIPVGPEYGNQELIQVIRNGDTFHVKEIMGVRYVPLIHP